MRAVFDGASSGKPSIPHHRMPSFVAQIAGRLALNRDSFSYFAIDFRNESPVCFKTDPVRAGVPHSPGIVSFWLRTASIQHWLISKGAVAMSLNYSIYL